MRVLILGYSSIVQRRVLPALRSLASVDEIHVATSRAAVFATDAAAFGLSGVHGDFAKALLNCAPDVVYVSLPNALHARYVRLALESGCHVVVDKPAFLDIAAADQCLALAAQRGLLLAEATVWDCHPVWERIAQLQGQVACTWRHIAATFVFPNLAADNFRRSQALGGGACNDVGPYAASCARLFLGTVTRLAAFTLDRDCDEAGTPGVDLAFAMVAARDRCAMTGQFGFGGEYANRLELIGDTARFIVEPAFTSPPSAPITIHWRHRDIEHATPVAGADCFAIFLARVLDDVRGGTERHAPWARRLEQDAGFLDQLRHTCEATL